MSTGFLGRSRDEPSIQIDQEMRLWTTARERDKYENMADLYSIIATVEHLEKAYSRDAIPVSEYAPACAKLIGQFKNAQKYTEEFVPNVPNFMSEYRLSCPAAANRLLHIGVPANVEHSTSYEKTGAEKYVAETVQHFITLMDSLKLNMAAVDQIHPLLSDLMESLNKIPSLPPDFEGKTKIKNWLVILNKMKASDELDESQVRQLLFDLENAHNTFYRSLAEK